jgi:hypothetical protein
MSGGGFFSITKGVFIMRRQHPADSIAISWHIDDVKEERPDLTKAQCREVLAFCKERHDAGIGLNWEVIRIQANIFTPKDADRLSPLPDNPAAQSGKKGWPRRGKTLTGPRSNSRAEPCCCFETSGTTAGF